LKIVLLTVLAIGCIACGSKPASEGASAPSALEGAPSPKLAGTWELKSGGKSTIDLKPDGTSRIVAEANSPGGMMKTDVSGQWSEKDGKLFMRRKGPDGADFTVDYTYTLDAAGKELKLSVTGRRTVQTYVKKKA
jgi:hypothetical protein